MKRNHFIVLALFAVLLLCTLFQLWAALTPLQQAEKKLDEKERALQNANTHLIPAHAEMLSKHTEWTQNEEELNRDNLLAASTARDPAALAALGIVHAADISDKLRLTQELAGKISTFNTKQKAVNDAAGELQTAWDTYIELAKHLSSGERYQIQITPLSLSPVTASLTCPVCNVTYSGENLGGIGDHITLCSVNGHKVSPYPYFSCESSRCPLSNEHHTFECEGCGEMFRQPTTIVTHSRGGGVTSEIYHDHRRDPCGKSTGLLTSCTSRAFTCRSPECPNDTNHRIDGKCGRHKVRKGDTAAVAAHQRVGRSCPETYTYPSGNTISCLIYIGYKCDEHSIHDYDPGSGTNPPPESLSNPITTNTGGTTNPPANPSERPCGHSTSASGDHSLQASCTSTDTNGNSCTVTSFYACDGHTHVYPAPPTLVPCSTCQGSYDPNDVSDVSRHTVYRNCLNPGCSVVFYLCNPAAAGPCAVGYSVHYANE